MNDGFRILVIGCTSAILAACGGGGSGSTGLFRPENAVLADVRQRGTCIELEGVPFCATGSDDAVAPGGQRAAAPPPAGTPGPGLPTSTPSPAGSPTISPQPGEPTAMPTPAGEAPPDVIAFVVEGFPEGAACQVAARPRGSGAPWRTGPLVSLASTPRETRFPLARGLRVSEVELVLLCFSRIEAGAQAETMLDLLTDAGPDVVFVR